MKESSPFRSPAVHRTTSAPPSSSKASPYKVAVSLLSSASKLVGDGSQSSAPDNWSDLFESFRKGRKAIKRATRNMMDGFLLESLVNTITNDSKSELLKCNLLVCLQENPVLFLQNDTKNMERVCSLLSKLLSSGVGLALQCQIVTTLTCLLVELSVASRQQRVFESFVELLLEIASRVGQSHDAVLRSTVCECLKELELIYPALLNQFSGNFYVFAQAESSVAYSSYVSLFVNTLLNTVKLAKAKGFAKKGLLLAPRSVGAFEIPDNSLSDGSSNSASQSSIPEVVVAEVRKSVAYVSSNVSLLLPSQAVALLSLLLRLQVEVGSEAVPPELFRQHFFRIMDLGSPLLLLGALQMRQRFPSLFSSSDLLNDEQLLRKILGCSRDASLPTELRCLALHMIREFGLWCGNGSCSVLHLLWRDMWPSVFDDWPILAGKLLDLVFGFGGDAFQSPPTLLSALSCLADFRKQEGSHFLSRLNFAVLRLIMARMPEQFDGVYRIFLDLLVYAPKFLPNLIGVMDDSAVCERLLNNFNHLLCRLEAAKLFEYVPLAEKICATKTIDATPLLERILACMTATDFVDVTDNTMEAQWLMGNSLLEMYRAALIYQSSPVWDVICKGLHLLSQRFRDVEVRDRAFSMWYMASHLAASKVAELLLEAEDENVFNEEVTAGGSPSSADKAPIQATVPTFLGLKRVLRLQEGMTWDWEQVTHYAEDQGDDETLEEQFATFIASYPPAQVDPLELPVSLHFLPPEDLKEDFEAPHCVIGVSVSFKDENLYFENEKLEIPMLRAEDSHQFTLRAAVSSPIPVSVKGFAEFSCLAEDGGPLLFACSDIGKLTWDLQDMFMDVPGNFTQGPALLRKLWQYYFKSGSKDVWCESVKRINKSKVQVEDFLLVLLKRYVVSWVADVVQVLMFLPPRFHLLLEVRLGQESSVCNIKTDYWQLLGSLDSFFSKV